MTRARYLRHVTLQTGHQRDSHLDEVAPQVVGLLRPVLIESVQGRGLVPLPLGPQPEGCALSGGVLGRCVSLTLWGPLDLAGPPAERAPLVEIGIAPHSRCGAALWRHLHEQAARLGLGVRTDRERCPPEPWVAALLYQPATLYPDVLEWAGDLERSLGWAWMAPYTETRR